MIRVLIVEDDYHVAAIHSAYVRRVDGLEVVGHAPTLATARVQLETETPDLVLLDLFLPDGGGLELLKESLSAPAQRPDFLVITAARDMMRVRAAMQLGALQYIVKPFDFAQIEQRLLSYRSMHRRLERLGVTEGHEAEQDEVDALYNLLRVPTATPKGQSGPTMTTIRDLLRSACTELSASEIATKIGISRSTAQRYLAEMDRQGRVEIHPHYGTTGRPELRYRVRRGGS